MKTTKPTGKLFIKDKNEKEKEKTATMIKMSGISFTDGLQTDPSCAGVFCVDLAKHVCVKQGKTLAHNAASPCYEDIFIFYLIDSPFDTSYLYSTNGFVFVLTYETENNHKMVSDSQWIEICDKLKDNGKTMDFIVSKGNKQLVKVYNLDVEIPILPNDVILNGPLNGIFSLSEMEDYSAIQTYCIAFLSNNNFPLSDEELEKKKTLRLMTFVHYLTMCEKKLTDAKNFFAGNDAADDGKIHNQEHTETKNDKIKESKKRRQDEDPDAETKDVRSRKESKQRRKTPN